MWMVMVAGMPLRETSCMLTDPDCVDVPAWRVPARRSRVPIGVACTCVRCLKCHMGSTQTHARAYVNFQMSHELGQRPRTHSFHRNPCECSQMLSRITEERFSPCNSPCENR
jgi:hypothetical protein